MESMQHTLQAPKFVNDIVLDRAVKFIEEMNHKGDVPVILEIGSGKGYFLKNLEKSLIARNLKCTIESGDIELGQMESDTITTRIFDAQSEFGLSKKYDLIIAIELIEHIENPFHFVREISKSLNLNGEVLITSPNILSLRSRFRFLLTGCYDYFRRPYNEYHLNMGHVNPINAIQLNYIFRKNGFKMISVKGNTLAWDSVIYLPLAPLVALITLFHYISRERSQEQKRRNFELLKVVLKPSMLLGKTAIYNYVHLSDFVANPDIWHRADENFLA